MSKLSIYKINYEDNLSTINDIDNKLRNEFNLEKIDYLNLKRSKLIQENIELEERIKKLKNNIESNNNVSNNFNNKMNNELNSNNYQENIKIETQTDDKQIKLGDYILFGIHLVIGLIMLWGCLSTNKGKFTVFSLFFIIFGLVNLISDMLCDLKIQRTIEYYAKNPEDYGNLKANGFYKIGIKLLCHCMMIASIVGYVFFMIAF